jgi:hypothetical protein
MVDQQQEFELREFVDFLLQVAFNLSLIFYLEFLEHHQE